jgi:hypothetical protein
MLFDRTYQRVQEVEVVKTYELDGFKLEFSKKSLDGSSKANLIESPGNVVHGVIHRMSYKAKVLLDVYEGLGKGYEMEFFEAEIYGSLRKIGFYIVKDHAYLCNDRPYQWYHECVLYGALENRLNNDHVRLIHQISSKNDHDAERISMYEKLLHKHRSRHPICRL